jgi:hypothetical protein
MVKQKLLGGSPLTVHHIYSRAVEDEGTLRGHMASDGLDGFHGMLGFEFRFILNQSGRERLGVLQHSWFNIEEVFVFLLLFRNLLV